MAFSNISWNTLEDCGIWCRHVQNSYIYIAYFKNQHDKEEMCFFCELKI